jgi:hypothetical protein
LDPLVFLPDWGKYGKRAGLLRNSDIVAASEVILAFWDGSSTGTLDTITKARGYGKKLLVIGPDGVELA